MTEDPERTVLTALADAEAQGRGALAEEELVATIGAGGASVRGLLDRMVKERLLQRTERDGRTWLAAGRRRTAPPAEPVTDAGALVDLIYAERRPSRWAHRPSVQAIGRLDDADFDRLAAELRSRGLLEGSAGGELALTDDGAALARDRRAARSPTPHWRIPAPALPHRELPLRVEPDDTMCPSAGCEGRISTRSAAWKGAAARRRPMCSRTWLIHGRRRGPGVPGPRNRRLRPPALAERALIWASVCQVAAGDRGRLAAG